MLYIETKSTDPQYNLAFEEYVLTTVGSQQNCFMLWQNDNAIIVGRHQNTVEEINLSYVSENNIRVVRRLTGGGAVYHDLGNLNFSFITGVSEHADLDFAKFLAPIISLLKSLGVNAEFTGRNDVVVDGKKVSGNSQYIHRNRLLHHGTLLLSSNLNKIASALKVQENKYVSKSTKSVRSRVANISDFLENSLSMEQFKELILAKINEIEPIEYWNPSDEALNDIQTPNFLKVNSLMTILCQVSMIAIAGIGGGLVIIAGGIDISCGSVMSFSTIIAAYMMVDMNINSWAAAIAALLATTIIGYIQGFLITKTKIPPMICGLGIMTAVKGAGYLICGGVSIYGVPEQFKMLSKGELFGAIPVPVIIMIVLYIAAAWFMKRTYQGRHFYAVGSNIEAAKLSGIKTEKVQRASYVIAGFMAGLAGLIMCARIGQGNANSYAGFEMDVITAVIIGGISFSGGSGKITSALLGALIMGVLKNGLVMAGVSDYWQQVVSGAVLITVVAYDSYQSYKLKHASK